MQGGRHFAVFIDLLHRGHDEKRAGLLDRNFQARLQGGAHLDAQQVGQVAVAGGLVALGLGGLISLPILGLGRLGRCVLDLGLVLRWVLGLGVALRVGGVAVGVFLRGAGGGGALLQDQVGVQLPETLFRHAEVGGDGFQGIPGLGGVGKGPGRLGQEQRGDLLGGLLAGPGGQIFIANVDLAVDVQGTGLIRGVLLLHQAQGLGDGLCVGRHADAGAVHGEGVHMLQLRDALQKGTGHGGQGRLHLVFRGQGGGDLLLVQGVIGGENLRSSVLRLGHGGLIGLLILEEDRALSLDLDLVAARSGWGGPPVSLLAAGGEAPSFAGGFVIF